MNTANFKYNKRGNGVLISQFELLPEAKDGIIAATTRHPKRYGGFVATKLGVNVIYIPDNPESSDISVRDIEAGELDLDALFIPDPEQEGMFSFPSGVFLRPSLGNHLEYSREMSLLSSLRGPGTVQESAPLQSNSN